MFNALRRSDTHAIALLRADHRKVEALYSEFEAAESSAQRVRLAREICTELTLHAQLEESLFYPAALKAFDREDDKLVHEAAVEHRTLKQLIEAIDGTGPSDKLFVANVAVLMEYVKHHVREEEREMFPALEGTRLDLEALGTRMLEAKERLRKALGRKRAPASRTRVSVASFGAPESSDRSIERAMAPRGRAGARKTGGRTAARKSATRGTRSSTRAKGAGQGATKRRAGARTGAAPRTRRGR